MKCRPGLEFCVSAQEQEAAIILAGRPGFNSWLGGGNDGIFLLTTASKSALDLTQPPVQWVPGALSPVSKRSGRESDHLPPSSAEVKNAWSCIFTPPIRLNGVGTGTTLSL
jgi:hypothetical protein